jgi:hypothetical protein
LNCWEHLQPLLRYNEYAQGVQIHIASWPAEFEMPDPQKIAWLYHETGEASYRASQFMAIEGATFVAVASQVLTEKNLERNGLTGNPVTKTVREGPLKMDRLLTVDVAGWWILDDLWARWQATCRAHR